MSDPRVQAGYMKDIAASLAQLGDAGKRMLAADPELFAAIDAAPRSAWLPIALNVRWVEAVERVFGWPAALDFLAARVRDQFGNPLFRVFVEGGVRLFGLDPGALVRLVPRGLSIAFRDHGEWSAVRTSETSIELRASALPKELAASARWIESIGGAALAMFALCEVSGSVRLAEHRAAEGRAVIEARWSPKRAPSGSAPRGR
jgi:hypothetical protein